MRKTVKPVCKCRAACCVRARAAGRKTVNQILKEAAFAALKNTDAYSATATLELATSRFPYGSTRELTVNH
jgi:hypothetical protein